MAADNAEQPTKAELTLLKALWRQSPLSAREIHDATAGATGWSYSSTRKTLDRMEAKKMVSVESVHRLKVYHASRSKLATVAGLISSFASDVLGARETLPAAALTGSDLINADEVDDLQALLDRLSDGGDD